jgi:hypothetical protein
MCIVIDVNVSVVTDDRNMTSQFDGAMESAVVEGRLQQTYIDVGGNETILFYVGDELPPNVSFPSIQPSLRGTSAPTASPNTTSTMTPTVSTTYLRAPTQTPFDDPSCIDTMPSCEEWANREPSECDRNPYVHITGLVCVVICI